MGMTRRAIIVHDRGQALAALDAAKTTGAPVLLLTAPGAARYAGPDYLFALVAEALAARQGTPAETAIDCGEDAGVAMAALRAGWKTLVFVGPAAVREKIESMAEQMGAAVLADAPEAVDIGTGPDAGKRASAWLRQSPA